MPEPMLVMIYLPITLSSSHFIRYDNKVIRVTICVLWFNHDLNGDSLPHVNVHTQPNLFIQYLVRNWPCCSLRGLHIHITWFSLYGIHIPLLSLYGIHIPLFPYMVIQPIVLGMALLWSVMDSSLSQGPLLWRHSDMTVIVSRNTHGRERDTWQRLDNAVRPATADFPRDVCLTV